MKNKSYFFELINKIHKPLARLIKKKKRRQKLSQELKVGLTFENEPVKFTYILPALQMILHQTENIAVAS